MGRSPPFDNGIDGVNLRGQAIKASDIITQEFEASPDAILHRLELFKPTVSLRVSLPLPVLPLDDVQGVVVSDSTWNNLFLIF